MLRLLLRRSMFCLYMLIPEIHHHHFAPASQAILRTPETQSRRNVKMCIAFAEVAVTQFEHAFYNQISRKKLAVVSVSGDL